MLGRLLVVQVTWRVGGGGGVGVEMTCERMDVRDVYD